MKRGMVDGDTTLSHHFLQITQAQGISQIPADTLSNKIGGIMQAFKRFLGQGQEILEKNRMLPDEFLIRQSRKKPIASYYHKE